MESAFEKWADSRSFILDKDTRGEYSLPPTDYAWQIWRQAWDAALEEAANEIKQRFVERNQFGEMVYCADLEQILRELKEQK